MICNKRCQHLFWKILLYLEEFKHIIFYFKWHWLYKQFITLNCFNCFLFIVQWKSSYSNGIMWKCPRFGNLYNHVKDKNIYLSQGLIRLWIYNFLWNTYNNYLILLHLLICVPFTAKIWEYWFSNNFEN